MWVVYHVWARCQGKYASTCSLHIENPRYNSVSKFYFIFIWSPTCFGLHTAHHQEPKTTVAASGFACVEGCWTCSCWTLSGSASYKYEIKFWYTVASTWIVLWCTDPQTSSTCSLCLDLICEVQFCLAALLKQAAARLDGVDLAHDHSASSPDRIHAFCVIRQDCSLLLFTPHTR